MIGSTLKSRWFATTVHVGLWILLALTLLRLGGGSLPYVETLTHTAAPKNIVPVARLENLFEIRPTAGLDAAAAGPSAFSTTHFVPPKPPPPTTRKVAVTYLGFYQTGEDPRQVFVQVDDALRVSPLGGQIATELFVAEAAVMSLTLTNAAAQTNVVKLNEKKIIEVPIR